jgi:hypothetical protein
VKAKIAALLALTAACSAAQAELYTYRFTTTITSVVECVNPFSCTEVGTSALAGSPVATGHTVSGTFTYNTATPVGSTTEFGWGTSRDFAEQGGAGGNHVTLSSDQDGLGFGATVATSYTYLIQDTVSGTDYLSLSAANSSAADYRSVTLEFADEDGSAFDGAWLPHTLPLAALESATFKYTYFANTPEVDPILRASGTLTSIELISSVPEPSAYALFAAGLGLLAWRRKRA